MSGDVIVTVAHLRMAGMCARQPRQWMVSHGLSWSEFITNGYPATVLLNTGDDIVNRVIAIALADPEAKYVGG